MAVFSLQTPDPLIDPCWDPVFKCIFTKDTPQSKKALKALLSAVLERDLEVVSVTASEPPVSRLSDRQIRYDMNCLLDNREKANVEMTLYPNAAYEALRLEYYLSRLYTGQELRGALSYGELQRSYQISFLARRNLFKDEHFYHRFVYHDPQRGTSLGGRTAVITLELRKLERAASKRAAEMTALERWAVFFGCYTEEGRRGMIQELAAMDEGIGTAEGVIQGFSAEEVARFHEISKEKYRLDMLAHRAEAREEARAEAREEALAEGLEKGQTLERQRILALLDQGLSPDEIRHRLLSL